MSVSIPVVIGTGRLERQTEKVARYMKRELESHKKVEAHLVDVREHLKSPFTVPAWVKDKNASKWRKIASEASGFVFVVPEYNHSFPGEFKLLLDSAYSEYSNKYALLVGVSTGAYGGVRVIQQLAPVFHELNVHLTGISIATSQVKTLFEEGEPTDAKYKGVVEKGILELIKNIT